MVTNFVYTVPGILSEKSIEMKFNEKRTSTNNFFYCQVSNLRVRKENNNGIKKPLITAPVQKERSVLEGGASRYSQK